MISKEWLCIYLQLNKCRKFLLHVWRLCCLRFVCMLVCLFWLFWFGLGYLFSGVYVWPEESIGFSALSLSVLLLWDGLSLNLELGWWSSCFCTTARGYTSAWPHLTFWASAGIWTLTQQNHLSNLLILAFEILSCLFWSRVSWTSSWCWTLYVTTDSLEFLILLTVPHTRWTYTSYSNCF